MTIGSCVMYDLFMYYCAEATFVIGCAPRGRPEWVGSFKSLCLLHVVSPGKATLSSSSSSGGGGGAAGGQTSASQSLRLQRTHTNGTPYQVCAVSWPISAVAPLMMTLFVFKKSAQIKRDKSVSDVDLWDCDAKYWREWLACLLLLDCKFKASSSIPVLFVSNFPSDPLATDVSQSNMSV